MSAAPEPAGRRPPPWAVLGPRRSTRQVGVPRWLLVPAGLAGLLVVLPVLALGTRVAWGDLPRLLTSDAARSALSLSLRTSAASTLLCLLLGVPLAVVLARSRTRWLGPVRSVVLLPLVLPPVVGGIALLAAFGRQGLLGDSLEALGVRVAFSTLAVVLAQTFVSLPFLVISLEGALRTAGERYDVVAASLGARPGTVLRRVTLPLVLPGLASGAVLAFARSLGEFGATITFAGSLEGTTRTLPLLIYNLRVTDADAAVAMSLLLVVVALAVIGLVRPRGAL